MAASGQLSAGPWPIVRRARQLSLVSTGSLGAEEMQEGFYSPRNLSLQAHPSLSEPFTKFTISEVDDLYVYPFSY